MTQHFLNGMDVCAVFQKMHCKRVTQRMGRDLFFDSRLLLVMLEMLLLLY